MDSSSQPMHTEDVALFTGKPVNVGEDQVTWIEHKPSFITQGGYSSIQFHIPGTGTQYTDLSQTELYIKLKITK